METNFIIALISMLFVAALPIVAKSVDGIFNLMEKETREEIPHKPLSH